MTDINNEYLKVSQDYKAKVLELDNLDKTLISNCALFIEQCNRILGREDLNIDLTSANINRGDNLVMVDIPGVTIRGRIVGTSTGETTEVTCTFNNTITTFSASRLVELAFTEPGNIKTQLLNIINEIKDDTVRCIDCYDVLRFWIMMDTAYENVTEEALSKSKSS